MYTHIITDKFKFNKNFLFYKLNFKNNIKIKNPNKKINKYLNRTINTRNINRLHSKHINVFPLKFLKPNLKKKIKSPLILSNKHKYSFY